MEISIRCHDGIMATGMCTGVEITAHNVALAPAPARYMLPSSADRRSTTICCNSVTASVGRSLNPCDSVNSYKRAFAGSKIRTTSIQTSSQHQQFNHDPAAIFFYSNYRTTTMKLTLATVSILFLSLTSALPAEDFAGLEERAEPSNAPIDVCYPSANLKRSHAD